MKATLILHNEDGSTETYKMQAVEFNQQREVRKVVDAISGEERLVPSPRVDVLLRGILLKDPPGTEA